MNQYMKLKGITVAVCAATAIALAGCSKGDATDHMARAKELIGKNDHRGATIELKNVLQKNADSAEARFLLGRELLVQGDPKNAEIELKKALDLKFDPDQVVPLLARSQMQQGNMNTVVNETVNVKLTSPAAKAEMQTLAGVAQFSLGRPEEASKAFDAAKSIVPDYPEALLGEARAKAAKGDLTGATSIVDDVIAKNPKLTEAMVLRGDLARARGANDVAIMNYESALALEPHNFNARLNLAGVYVNTRDTAHAQQQVDELKKQSPRHPMVNYLDAVIALSNKDFVHANDAVTISLATGPTNPNTQLLAGAIATAMDQPQQAEQHLTDSLKGNPGNIYARKLLTSLYLRQHEPQKAEQVLQPALTSAPNDQALVSLSGEVALLKGDYANASKAFDRAGKLNPADANVRTQGAAVLFARGDVEGGFAELESASEANKTNNPNPDIALVLARLQRKEYDQALAAWKVLEKRQPDNPMTYNLLAAVDVGKKDVAGARKALEKAVELNPTYFPAIANLASMDVRENNVDGARKRLKDLLAKQPGNESVLMALAQLENSQGASAETVTALLKEARRANPNSEQVVGALASFYVSKGDPKSALAVAQEGLASSPNSPRYLDLVGSLMLQTGSVDQAVAAYKKLVGLNPAIADYQIRLGQAQLAAGQSEVALQTFGSVIKLKSDSPEAQATVVGMMLRAGKIDEASRLLTDIRSLSPKSPVLPELDADLKFANKDYFEAAAAYRKVLAAAPRPNLVVKTYTALTLTGKRSDADALLADWLKTHPKDSAMRLFDADMALRYKDYARATQSYRAALEGRPNDPVVLNNLAWALWQQKDPQALAFAEKASALAPTSPAVSDTLGWMLVEQGQTKRGVELLVKANAAAPQQRDIALHLAKAQMKDGHKDAARTILQGLVKSAPDSPEAKESRDLLATL